MGPDILPNLFVLNVTINIIFNKIDKNIVHNIIFGIINCGLCVSYLLLSPLTLMPLSPHL